MSSQYEDLWTAVRLLAEGSDWKRDQGETLIAWAQCTIKEVHDLRRLNSSVYEAVTYQEARDYLGKAVTPDGKGLYDLSMYVNWEVAFPTRVTLDGEYTIADLEAIARFMRGP